MFMNKIRVNLIIFKLTILSIIGILSIYFSNFPISNNLNMAKNTFLAKSLLVSFLFILLGIYTLKKTSFPFNFKNAKSLLTINSKNYLISFTIALLLGGFLLFISPNFNNLLLQSSFLGEFNTSLFTKFLYNGINEEIIMRLGVLTILYGIFSKFTPSKNAKILALAISSFLFALSYLPIYTNNSINFTPIFLIVGTKFIYGIIYGYLYMKYNLITSIICHAFTYLFHFMLTLIIIN